MNTWLDRDVLGVIESAAVAGHLPVVVSFDIDGTLETGDPPGPLPLAVVRHAQARGYVVGSCSDRTVREQREMWEDAGIVVDFAVVKNALASVRERFPTARLIHIGDSAVDEHYARIGGFEYVFVGTLPPDCPADGRVPWLDAFSAPLGNARKR